MTAGKLGIHAKQATVILGAGATRGANCFTDAWVSAPLDADFFLQVQKLAALDRRIDCASCLNLPAMNLAKS
jgi:hypothetical protein